MEEETTSSPEEISSPEATSCTEEISSLEATSCPEVESCRETERCSEAESCLETKSENQESNDHRDEELERKILRRQMLLEQQQRNIEVAGDLVYF